MHDIAVWLSSLAFSSSVFSFRAERTRRSRGSPGGAAGGGHVPATAARFAAMIAGASVERLSGFGRSERGLGQPSGFQNGGNAATSRVRSRHLSGVTRAVEWRARRETTTRAECARVVLFAAKSLAHRSAQ
jgi:hypothetical protein